MGTIPRAATVLFASCRVPMFLAAVLAASYGVLALTILHAIFGNWSGTATLGNLGAAVFSVPFLLLRAWQLRAWRTLHGPNRLIWILAIAFPVAFLGFWAIAIAWITFS